MSRPKRICYEVPEQGIALIPVGESAWAMIDLEDFELVAPLRWHLSHGYARHSYYSGGGAKKAVTGSISMHRLITGLDSPLLVDHKHFDRLDNRKAKLRKATRSQNNQNRRGASRNSGTGVRGVKACGRYFRAQVNANGVRHEIGAFRTIVEAEVAVRAARAHYMTHSAECQGEKPPLPAKRRARLNHRSTGTRGVYPVSPGKQTTRYFARIGKVRLGCFDTIAEADAAVRAAECT
jgi:hypothetical protein